MKKETLPFTYSISLLFDNNTASSLNILMNKISELTNNNYHTSLNIPPHITLGMFKQNENNENDKEEFIKILNPIFQKKDEIKRIVTIESFDTLKNKVIYGKFREDDVNFLRMLNKEIYSLVRGKYKEGCNGLYKIDTFYPHITLGTGLTKTDIEKCFNEIFTKEKEIECKIEKISIAIRKPYCVFYEK